MLIDIKERVKKSTELNDKLKAHYLHDIAGYENFMQYFDNKPKKFEILKDLVRNPFICEKKIKARGKVYYEDVKNMLLKEILQGLRREDSIFLHDDNFATDMYSSYTDPALDDVMVDEVLETDESLPPVGEDINERKAYFNSLKETEDFKIEKELHQYELWFYFQVLRDTQIFREAKKEAMFIINNTSEQRLSEYIILAEQESLQQQTNERAQKIINSGDVKSQLRWDNIFRKVENAKQAKQAKRHGAGEDIKLN